MHLVGFTIEIYYDARPYERQVWLQLLGSIVKPLFEKCEQAKYTI